MDKERGWVQSSQVQTQLWMEQFPSMGRDSLLCSGHLERTNATNTKPSGNHLLPALLHPTCPQVGSRQALII